MLGIHVWPLLLLMKINKKMLLVGDDYLQVDTILVSCM